MGRLSDRVAIVTGGVGGIGAAVVRLLASEGAAVVIADVREEEGADLAAELGGRARHVYLDVSDEAGWRQAVDEAERELGPVSVLVNNAGVTAWGPMEEQRLDSFRRVIDINLQGPWLGMRAVAPSLRRAGGGVIVNISSLAGLTAYAGIGAYAASKWGLRGLTKAAALELAPDRVRVCSVHPGAIRTPMTAGFDDSYVSGQPIPRFGEPEEVARMVLFIIADATFSTGSEFVLDGGVLAGPSPADVLSPDD
ncbi:glucose 1-dehydrogenase [Streptomyces ipomoeae]|uniref:Oxidoreductase, short chain dehydrogenase/reductase family protein n=2 Tax=Streptomyces ipomoeae TaxID=103232 RepID=L1KQI0_9ACTN|nr:glucose 1-dehydrogenase [Streptomyces ipomoeae]EKX62745.1 oxidoreductase, short chain dehydrogenase/reductase family protein [Streptomyces ipomoeae 91-03]MDX2696379.1 glucose 1-dehydrogenase [Streptomyces ipomoeae]MDX2823997.1 glucose 1-dehydrogenase [Streptomyces ipomoeae]MDX2845835.1 glucose 1-dehydrogenase [Streptomyces ipomoeae]MDX2876555.1 glucose 1-dehydrogenase [Streptomyces ipomoeae]